jgi:hypothetical protein
VTIDSESKIGRPPADDARLGDWPVEEFLLELKGVVALIVGLTAGLTVATWTSRRSADLEREKWNADRVLERDRWKADLDLERARSGLRGPLEEINLIGSSRPSTAAAGADIRVSSYETRLAIMDLPPRTPREGAGCRRSWQRTSLQAAVNELARASNHHRGSARSTSHPWPSSASAGGPVSTPSTRARGRSRATLPRSTRCPTSCRGPGCRPKPRSALPLQPFDRRVRHVGRRRPQRSLGASSPSWPPVGQPR